MLRKCLHVCVFLCVCVFLFMCREEESSILQATSRPMEFRLHEWFNRYVCVRVRGRLRAEGCLCVCNRKRERGGGREKQKRDAPLDERFRRQTQVRGRTCWGGTLFFPKKDDTVGCYSTTACRVTALTDWFAIISTDVFWYMCKEQKIAHCRYSRNVPLYFQTAGSLWQTEPKTQIYFWNQPGKEYNVQLIYKCTLPSHSEKVGTERRSLQQQLYFFL